MNSPQIENAHRVIYEEWFNGWRADFKGMDKASLSRMLLRSSANPNQLPSPVYLTW